MSGVVDEKDERVYLNPDDTVFNALLGDSPFHDALLGARCYSVDLSLSSGLRTGHRRPIHSWHCY